MSSTIRMTGLVSGLDTESIIEALMDAQDTKLQKLKDKETLLTWKQEAWEELNTQLYDLYTGALSKIKLQSSYLTKTATASDDAVTVTAGNNATAGTNKITVSSLAAAQYVTSGEITATDSSATVSSSTTLAELGMTSTGSTITITNGGEEVALDVDSTTTIADFVDACKEAGLSASFDETLGRIFIGSTSTGTAQSYTITSDNADALSCIGLSDVDGTAAAESDTDTGMTVTAAADAVFTLNGATLTSSSNTITVNNLTITLNDTTTTAVNVTVASNSQDIYNMVKDFFSEYNTILANMNELYYADSADDYDPLTDEEKEAMTDYQIEKWEDTIKDSILRRDSTLGSLLTAMKSAMSSTVKVDGKTYSLATFGISTSSDYTEKGLLHIYGDSDDSTYSDETDKLLAAIEEDPEATMEALTGIFTNLYKTMTNKMAGTTLSSALTFYNDKSIASTLDDYEDDIEEFEDKMEDMETAYYEKFAAMETALAKMQAQSSALSALLGS